MLTALSISTHTAFVINLHPTYKVCWLDSLFVYTNHTHFHTNWGTKNRKSIPKVSQTVTPHTPESSSAQQLQAWLLLACLVGPQHLLNQIRNSGEGMHIEMLKSSAILALGKIHGIEPIKNKLGQENY